MKVNYLCLMMCNHSNHDNNHHTAAQYKELSCTLYTRQSLLKPRHKNWNLCASLYALLAYYYKTFTCFWCYTINLSPGIIISRHSHTSTDTHNVVEINIKYDEHILLQVLWHC